MNREGHMAQVQRRLGCLLVAGMALALAPGATLARTVLVFGPHEDDEVLIAAGRVRAAVNAGDTVKMVLVTNGDVGGTGNGLLREGESVAAAQVLGLTEQDVVFMGYGDTSLWTIYSASSGTQVFRSSAGQTATYGNRGLGGMDYHRFLTGVPGPYNRNTLLGDFRALIQNFLPDEIYTVSNFDTHPDHQATSLFVTEALVGLKRSGLALATRLYHSIVWPPTNGPWPDLSGIGGCSPGQPFPPPPWGNLTQLDWDRLVRFPVPLEMQILDPLTSLKCVAISQFHSQFTPWLASWARKDEFFWLQDFGLNQAITAQATASSERVLGGAMRAIDGVVDGAGNDPSKEWVSAGQGVGAWIQLSWPGPVKLGQVNLFDRPDTSENVMAGLLTFSDGSSVAVGALPDNGRELPIAFPPRTVTWVRFSVTAYDGVAAGLAEFQALGTPGGSTANIPPLHLQGPVPVADTIRSSQTTTFATEANDLDGDPVQFAWSADGGSLAGSGSSAVFTPPAVTVPTVVTVTSQLSDGRGGVSTNVGFVTVTPAVNGLTLSPTSVAIGGTAEGTVTLASPAPAGGLTIPLRSSDPATASAPSSLVVPARGVTGVFTVTAGSPLVATPVVIIATIGGVDYPATLTVSPIPPPPPPPTGNILLSPNAIGAAPWENWGNITTVTDYALAPDGTQTASRAVASTAGGHALVQAGVAVTPGTTYVFSFYAMNHGGAAASYSVYDNSHGADLVPPTSYISRINGSLWTQVSVSFVAPVGCTSINVYPLRDSGVPVDILLWGAALVVYTPPPTVDGVAIAPAAVVSGGQAQGSLTLGTAAPPGGLSVPLASADPLAVGVPAAVLVPAGASTATFPVTTGVVPASTAVNVTASFPAGPRTATLTVNPLAVSTLALTPASILAGSSSQGRVALNAPAPGDVLVALASGNPGAASTPTSVVVPAGASTATFVVSSGIVGAPTPVVITASFGASSASATLTVAPLSVSSLAVTPASVVGGGAAQATVGLNGLAGSGGVAAVLTSSNPAVVAVPPTADFPAGAGSASVSVTTVPVAVSVPVTLTASYGGATSATVLTVTAPALTAMAVAPTPQVGGGVSTGTLTLSSPAPAGGVTVTLTSSAAAAVVPAAVTIPGGATSATFAINTTLVTAATNATISAMLAGTTRTATLALRSLAVSLSPTAVAGGAPSTGTVRLNATVAFPVTVTLGSSNGAAVVPATVTIPAGATSATFPVSTGPVAATTSVTISASYGAATRTAALSVRRVTAAALSVSPTSVVGGGASTGTVRISIAAPPGGFPVALASNRTAATVPATVTVATGATTATFPIATSAVTASTAATISAQGGGVTRTAILTVTP